MVIQVADFLQDEDTLASATCQAHSILVNCGHKRSAGCMEAVHARSAVEVSAACVEELLSLYALQPQLAINILCTQGNSELPMSERMYFWLLRLPPSCRQMIIASAIRGSCLEVCPSNYSLASQVTDCSKHVHTVSAHACQSNALSRLQQPGPTVTSCRMLSAVIVGFCNMCPVSLACPHGWAIALNCWGRHLENL